MADPPSLERFWERKKSNLEHFREEQHEVWEAVDGAYFVVASLIHRVALLPDLDSAERLRYLLWCNVLDYQMESFLLILDRRLDESMALLRISSELARDIARIGDEASKADVWLRKNEHEGKREYRRTFRFDETDKAEKHVFLLYNIASDFGVHGHVTGMSALRAVKDYEDRAFVELAVTETGMLRILEIWLAAFFPVHDTCVKAFWRSYSSDLAEPYKLYLEFQVAFADLYKDFCDELKARERGTELD